MKSKLWPVFLLVLLPFSACEQKELYFKFQPIRGETWNSRNVVDFRLDSVNALPEKQYAVSVEIVSNNQYPYQNLWLCMEQNITDTTFVNDTLEVKITDLYGKRLGTGGAALHQLSVPYKKNVVLDSARSYLIRVRHIMSDEFLPGIEQIGLRIQ
ncbi:MAG: gliding motility lipoprotein GldH [Bacteroidia bacterium]|nr:gliding motility lipoprotein GldH [Bacteroidia bacterium]